MLNKLAVLLLCGAVHVAVDLDQCLSCQYVCSFVHTCSRLMPLMLYGSLNREYNDGCSENVNECSSILLENETFQC